ncbi:MAG: hypothetical protein ABS882_08955 [Lysinibacillus sp.]
MNKKFNMIVAIIGSITILTIGALLFNQMYNNHRANQLIIEKCFDNFDNEGEVKIKKDGFWSPVACEKK